MARRTYRALNGLRFFAALGVIGYHYVPAHYAFGEFPLFIKNLFFAGPSALAFFYILSGFILTEAYRDRLPCSSAARKSFWWARFARLYPVYLFAFILFLPMAYEKYLHHQTAGMHGVRSFCLGGLLSLFAVQAWTSLSLAWNGPSWSLSVEAFFYFLFPYIVVRILNARSAVLYPVVFTLWAGMVSISLLYIHGSVSVPLWSSWIEHNPLFWSPLFIAGVALARFTSAWARLPRAVVFITAFTALALFLLLCAYLSPNHLAVFIAGGSAPLLALIIISFSHPTSASSHMLGTKALFELGGVSFVTYILQAPVWHISQKINAVLHRRPMSPSTNGTELALYLIALIVISFLVQAFIERPAQEWLLKSNKRNTIKQGPVLDPGIEAV